MITLYDADAALRSLLLSAPRIAAAFLILPILSREDCPPLVRNTIYVALAIAVTPFLNAAVGLPRDFVPWAGIIVKEILIGVTIGFAFSGVLWAVGMAGEFIDTKVGTNMAAVVDPLGGHQTTLTGGLLARFANYLFMALGGLILFLEILLASYQLWPIPQPLPNLNLLGVEFFARNFGAMLSLAFMLAVPALIVMSMIDLALGIMNRYAPQLNVLPIAMAIKAWLSSGLVLLGITAFVAVVIRHFDGSRRLLDQLRPLFS
jgi:type III secretion protein T